MKLGGRPRWAGRIVKAHPGYSGTILTATYQTARDVGWDYYEKLNKNDVLIVPGNEQAVNLVKSGERPIAR